MNPQPPLMHRPQHRPQKPRNKPQLSYHQKQLRLLGIVLVVVLTMVFALAFYFLERKSIIGIP